MRRCALLAFVLVMALSACDETPTAPSAIVGRAWRLVSLQEPGAGAPIVVEDPSRYRLTFVDNGTLAVTSDCNSCSADCSLSASSLADSV